MSQTDWIACMWRPQIPRRMCIAHDRGKLTSPMMHNGVLKRQKARNEKVERERQPIGVKWHPVPDHLTDSLLFPKVLFLSEDKIGGRLTCSGKVRSSFSKKEMRRLPQPCYRGRMRDGSPRLRLRYATISAATDSKSLTFLRRISLMICFSPAT